MSQRNDGSKITWALLGLSSAGETMAPFLCMWIAAFFGVSQGCPEPCTCVEKKFGRQLAECAYRDLQEVPAGLPSNVTTLSLSANRIRSLQQRSFLEVTQVSSLWLAHNEISAIEAGTFAGLLHLKNIDLSHNQLADFPWRDLHNLSALQLLKMNNNQLARLPADAFRTLRDLRSLWINDNKLATIAQGTFDSLTSLSHLQIYNNPLNCTCALLWLKGWAENTLISIPERDSISCAAPDSFRGLPLARVPAGVAAQYVSNHAFNQSGPLKPHAFALGIIALDVSEREARVQLTPYPAQPEKAHLRALYLCAASGPARAPVQWSLVQEGVNSYWFQGLSPGTNYSVCLTHLGEECQVQVVFTTKAEVPSLLIIVAVSIFLLALATVPLLGATCCHLLAKHQGKTYKLIMRAQNPDPMEKHMAADFDPRASYLESEKNYNPSEAGAGAAGERELEREESLVAESIAECQSKANPEEFEVGSEYSDRLPLGAEAVNISQEINGNYRQPAR
nr:immunoglobulin superfamily containing leucine-rich repeat protein 2 [Pelodiscus sinensis]|eukprot:XP_014428009.1 immunoglobulin superfamily containing leucine-rich repeat protein 2 [Pelodiscus sinensis]